MSSFAPRLVKSGKTKMRFQFALIGLGVGLSLLFVAIKFDTNPFLVTSSIQKRADRIYTRVWFDSDTDLIGAIQKGNQLQIDRWTPKGSVAGTWHFDLGELEAEPKWTISSSLVRLAWLSGSKLWIL